MLNPSASLGLSTPLPSRPKPNIATQYLPPEQVLSVLQEDGRRSKCSLCCGLLSGVITLGICLFCYSPLVLLTYLSEGNRYSSFTATGVSANLISVDRLRNGSQDQQRKLSKARGFGREAGIAAMSSMRNVQSNNLRKPDAEARASSKSLRLPFNVRALAKLSNRLMFFPLPFAFLSVTQHALVSEGLWIGSSNESTAEPDGNERGTGNHFARKRTAFQTQLSASLSNFFLNLGAIGIAHLISRRYFCRISSEYQRRVTEQWWDRCRSSQNRREMMYKQTQNAATGGRHSSSMNELAQKAPPADFAPSLGTSTNHSWFKARTPYAFGTLTGQMDTIQALWCNFIYHVWSIFFFSYAATMHKSTDIDSQHIEVTDCDPDNRSHVKSKLFMLTPMFTGRFYGMSPSNTSLPWLTVQYINVCNPRWRQWADYEAYRQLGPANMTGTWLQTNSALQFFLASGNPFDDTLESSAKYYPKQN